MKSLILTSGGIKSAFLTCGAKKEGELLCLHLNWNQPSFKKEHTAVQHLLDFYSGELLTIEIAPPPPEKETFLRFLYFVTAALPYARTHHCQFIYYGLSKDDPCRYYDGIIDRDTFIEQLQDLVHASCGFVDQNGNYLGQVMIETPLRRLTLKQVIVLGTRWSIPWEYTYSCTNGKWGNTDDCFHCKRRRQAFMQIEAEAGTTTTTTERSGKRYEI